MTTVDRISFQNVRRLYGVYTKKHRERRTNKSERIKSEALKKRRKKNDRHCAIGH